ncbi:MAG: ATP-binding protein [Dysgonamonadaceae bacterium]|jgi:AAA15 family ATPase/GTPase|nr:ATP-binding protein [Dysgonamonadaceae bacterium]
MLINFSIQNYGSIKDKQILSFEADKSKHLEDYYVINTNGLRLLKLGLIYGANASGKTTILKALDFLHTLVLNPKYKKTDIFEELKPFKFNTETINQNTIFEIEFLQNNTRYLYSVELNKEAIVKEELYSFNPKKSNVFKRNTKLQNLFTTIEFGNKIKAQKSAEETLINNTLWNNTVLGGFLKTNIDIQELKDVVDWFRSNLSVISSNEHLHYSFMPDPINPYVEEWKKYKNEVLPIIKKADMNISDFEIENHNLRFEHIVNNAKFQIEYELESEGTQRYFNLAYVLWYALKSPRLISIDELESSLHPDLFQHFILTFLVNSKHSQIIATTHNREILNDKDIFRNDAIWITDKDNKDCATELYSLADFDTSVIRDTSNIYNAYKIGKLGGVPNLGDYYLEIE